MKLANPHEASFIFAIRFILVERILSLCFLLVAVKAWFNNAAYHSSAAILNAVNNARFRYVTGTSGSITTINHPLPRTTSQSIDDLSRQVSL